jgi:hypothetical protein
MAAAVTFSRPTPSICVLPTSSDVRRWAGWPRRVVCGVRTAFQDLISNLQRPPAACADAGFSPRSTASRLVTLPKPGKFDEGHANHQYLWVQFPSLKIANIQMSDKRHYVN